MSTDYTFLAELSASLPAVPADTIVSRTLLDEPHLKVVLFGFSPGQTLSEHTASMPAVLHFLQGEGQITLGEDQMAAQPGAWAHMPAHLPHSIRAETEVHMLLLMIKN